MKSDHEQISEARRIAAPVSPQKGTQARNRSLDGWRCFACMLVFFYHKGIYINVPPFIIEGFTGVHMFFVLSGYLLFYPFATALLEGRAQPSWRLYYHRRFLRIYPPYILSFLVYLSFRFLLKDKMPDSMNTITHVLLIFNYFDDKYFFAINGVFWSLAIEAQFYVLLPLICRATAALTNFRPDVAIKLMLTSLFVTGLCSRMAEIAARGPDIIDGISYTYITSYLDWFSIGMTVAYIDRRYSAWLHASKTSRIMLFASGFALFLTANNWYARSITGTVHVPDMVLTIAFPTAVCVSLGIILLSVCSKPASETGLLQLAPIVWIGTVSYSIFLYHSGVQVAMQRLFPLRSIHDWYYNAVAQSMISLPPTIILSAAMFYIVERPCLRAMSRLKTESSPRVDRTGTSSSELDEGDKFLPTASIRREA